ncbi:hypothetical protein Q7P35_005558 [Cladosporium inversicolor]
MATDAGLTDPNTGSDRLDWLDELHGRDAVAWAETQNMRTKELLKDEDYHKDFDELRTALGHADKAPEVTKIDEFVYNFWTDAQHPQGIWRRMPYAEFITKFKCGEACWDVLLDLDALSREDEKEYFWDGVDILPIDRSRAIIHLSDGGADAAQLREWDFVSRTFVENGFNLDTAISSVTWLDADTLLLASSHGGALNSTASGGPRTIRLWHRGQPVDNTKILFSTAHESERVSVERDWSVGQIRMYLTETIDGDRRRHYIAQGDFDFKLIGLPQDVRCEFGSDLAAVYLREDWTTAARTFPMDTLLVMSVDSHGACICPEVLWEGTGGSALHDFQFINGCMCINLIEHLRPLLKLFVRGANGWREGQMPPLTTDGVISIKPLNHFAHEMDSTVVITEQSPTLPRRISLSTLDTREAPLLLRQSRQIYDATDVVIEYHSVYMEDVGPIPYVHIGPARTKDTSMPLYMYGYGGFGGSVLPTYNKILGVLVYQHGWSAVITCLPGDGTNGLRYERAGRKEFKIHAHDAFATVAKDLVERGVTEASRIVAAGASNGGLMAGMMLPRFPDRFAALACELPLTDLRRFQRWSAGQAWVAEYPLSLEDRLKISPCDNMTRATQDAPHVLVFTNRLDDRVHPAHARRYAYLLQEHGHDALFFEAESGGHGYGANTLQIAEYFALRNSFYRRALASQD